MKQSRLIPFFFMLIVYLLTMGLYYNQTHSILIQETEKQIENILLSQRALGKLVSQIQKPEVFRLQDAGILHHDYFSPELLSSSYITIKLNELANEERKELGLAPLLFKYAAPNPTNPTNLADTYDMSVYQKFQNGGITKYKETMTEDNKNFLYYAIAGKTIYGECLQCHGKPEDAPKALIERYGSENGFAWKIGDLSSIISIKAPLDGIYKENDERFFLVSFIVFVVFTLLFVLAEITHDHLERKEQSRKEKTKDLEESIESLYDHVISSKFDMQGNLVEVSSALSRLSGYSKEELLGKSFCFFKHPDNDINLFPQIWKTLQEGKQWMGEVKNLSKDGKVFWVEVHISPKKDKNNTVYVYESIMRIITDKKALLEDIKIDPLTSLLNRRSFEECFTSEMSRAKRDKKFLALLMLDIDFFKQYNDHYGHQKGDEALKKVAKSLQDSFHRSSDFVFRLGGEEFAVLTSEVSVSQLLNSARHACSQIHKLEIEHKKSTVSPFLTISIGMTIIIDDSYYTLDEIYAQSDKALYKAKESGRNKLEYVEL